jgi:shikimate kinase
MSLVLIGYRGSGKTTIGRKLAERLVWPFIDSDERIVAKAGKSIKQIFEESGEEGFRNLETKVIEELCDLPDHVLALGGGAVKRPENRSALRAAGHTVVYLSCKAEELHRRIQGDPKTKLDRPNLTGLGGGLAEVEKLLAEREPLYREIDDLEVDVSGLSPDQAVNEIIRRTAL